MKINYLANNQGTVQSIYFWGICFILFLPIIILPPIFQPSDWNRAILFRIILTVLIAFLFYRFFYKKDISISLPKWKNSVYSPLLILGAFFITLILATIFSQDPRFSFFGSPERAGGLLNYLFFFIFTIFLALFIKENIWEKLFNALFIVGILASLLGVIQYFGILKNIFISWGEGGVPSFLGNSTFLAIYMLFLTFLSFTLLTRETEKKKKIFHTILLLLFIFTIFITGSRSTYLAILLGFLYFFFFYPKKLKKLKVVAASILLIAVLVVFLFNLFPQLGEKNHIFAIISNRLSIKTIAVDLMGTRFSAWKITLEAIKDKPLLGWGLENFYIGFEKHYDPTLSNLQRLWWDRPHNILLDIAVSSGVISLFFYITFWIVLLWQLQKFKRSQGNVESTYLAHGIQTMFLGYLIVLFFNFDNLSTYLISFFFVGYAFYLISSVGEKITIYPIKNNAFQKKPALIVFLLLIFLFLWIWNIWPFYLNGQIIYAKNLAGGKKCDKAVLIMNDVWEKSNMLKSYATLKYSDFLKNCVSFYPEKEVEYATKGLKILEISSAMQPKFTRTWLFMGGFANVLAAREKNIDSRNKLLSKAMDYLKKARNLSPGRQEIIIEMAKNYIVAQDYQAMKGLAYECINIDKSNGECYWYLGISEIFLGDQESGKKHIQESKEKNYNNPPYIQLGAAYISQKNYKDAAEAYRMLIAIYPENANYHAAMAVLLREIGDYNKAVTEALEVFRLLPNDKEAEEFLKSLLGLGADSIQIHSSLAYIYRISGNNEKETQELLIIKSYYSKLVINYPNMAAYHLDLANVDKELKDYESSYKEAILTLELNLKLKNEVEKLLQMLPPEYLDKYQDYIRSNPSMFFKLYGKLPGSLKK